MPISKELLEDIKQGRFREETLALALLGDEINDEDAISIAEALKDNPYIKKINLRDSNIGDIGVQALATVETLEELDVSNDLVGYGNDKYKNHITAIGAEALAKSNLQELKISGNLIGDEGIKFLASSKTIIKLEAVVCGILSLGAAKLFKVNNTLKELDLSANSIGDEGVSTLHLNHTLKQLDLEEC